MDKLIGFMPDAEATTPGILTDCTNLVPYDNGLAGAPSGVIPSGVPVLAAACIGAATITKLDGVRRLFAGTATKLYEIDGTWLDVSRVGNYSGGVETRLSFAQFGDATLVANGVQKIQRSASGAFADIASAPVAKIVFSVGAFVMALNTNDGAVKPDGWHCCASFVDTDWTPNVATLATSGRLVSTPGAITAGGRLGEYAIAYKEKAIYVGQFVGAPAVWDWLQVPGGEAGCVGQEAWCDIGGAHLIVGQDNLWVFDGSRPTAIGDNTVRQWFFDNSSPLYRYKTKCVFDRQTNLAWVFYCSKNASTPDAALVYHVPSKRWGKVTLSVEAVMDYISGGTTIDALSSISATIDGLSSFSFDSQYWLSGGRSLAYFDGVHQLRSLTGVSQSSSFTTGHAGDDDRVTRLSKIRLRFAPGYAPNTASVQTFSTMTQGDALTPRATATLNDGKFDVLQEARFHVARFDMTGDVRVIGLGAELTPTGTR